MPIHACFAYFSSSVNVKHEWVYVCLSIEPQWHLRITFSSRRHNNISIHLLCWSLTPINHSLSLSLPLSFSLDILLFLSLSPNTKSKCDSRNCTHRYNILSACIYVTNRRLTCVDKFFIMWLADISQACMTMPTGWIVAPEPIGILEPTAKYHFQKNYVSWPRSNDCRNISNRIVDHDDNE